MGDTKVAWKAQLKIKMTLQECRDGEERTRRGRAMVFHSDTFLYCCLIRWPQNTLATLVSKRHPTTTQRRYSPQSPTCRNPVNLCYNSQHPGKCLKNNVPDIKPRRWGRLILSLISSVFGFQDHSSSDKENETILSPCGESYVILKNVPLPSDPLPI